MAIRNANDGYGCFTLFIYTTCGQRSSVKAGYDNLVSVKFNATDAPDHSPDILDTPFSEYISLFCRAQVKKELADCVISLAQGPF